MRLTSVFIFLLATSFYVSAWPYETFLDERQTISTTIEDDSYTIELVEIEDYTNISMKAIFKINGDTLPKLSLYESYLFDDKLIVSVTSLSSTSLRARFVAEQSFTFDEGERRPIAVGNNNYDIEAMVISENKIVFKINGQVTPLLAQQETFTLSDSTILRVKNIIDEGQQGAVTFSFSKYCGDYYCDASRETCGACSADCACLEGYFCKNGRTCETTSCGDTICASGEFCPADNCCNGENTNMSSIANCGMCGVRCAFGETCYQGNCTALCDGVPCPVPTDEDSDGVQDGVDLCKKTPKECPVDKYGCPKDDEDSDGICNTLDLKEGNTSQQVQTEESQEITDKENVTAQEKQSTSKKGDWFGLFLIFFVLGVVLLTVFYLVIRR